MTPLELRRALEQILHEECNVSVNYETEHRHPITPLERDSIETRIVRLFENWRQREEQELRRWPVPFIGGSRDEPPPPPPPPPNQTFNKAKK